MKRKLIQPMILITFAIVLYMGLSNTDMLINLIKKFVAIFIPILVGLALAFIINVLLSTIEKLWCRIWRKSKRKWHEKAKRPVCLVISLLIFLGVIFALVFMVLPEIIRTGENLVNMLPTYIANFNKWWAELQENLSHQNISIPEITLDTGKITEVLMPIINENKDLLIDKTLTVTGSIFSGAVDAVLAFAFSIYVLAQKEKIGERIKQILYAFFADRKVDKVLHVADVTNQTFTNFIRGQLTEAVIIGMLCFIGMQIFQMPYAPIISVLVGATALIPIVGAFAGTAVGAFLILLVDPLKAFWFVVFIIILQQLEGNLIYPKVVGQSVGIPGILVLTAVTVGGNAFGLVGMLLGVPTVAVLYCLLKQVVETRLEKKNQAKEHSKAAKEVEQPDKPAENAT